MISRESTNKLFNSLAEFVSKLTGRSVQFHQIGEEPIGVAGEKMSKFFNDAAAALDNPNNVQLLGALEPRSGRVYCLQVDMNTVDMEFAGRIVKSLEDRDINVVVVDQNLNFVSIPEGYEVVKKE